MKTTVVALPEGHIGVVSLNMDGVDVPIARTKAFPFDRGNGATNPSTWRSATKAQKAASKLSFKLAKKLGNS